MNFRLLKYLAVFFATTVYSQYSDTSYLRAMIGYEKNGITGSISYDKHVGQDAFMRFGIEGQFEKYTFQNQKLPVQLALFNVAYYHRIMSIDLEQAHNLYLGAGLLGGYENLNNGKKNLPNNAELLIKSKFIYGLNADAQLDIYLFEAGRHADGGVFLLINGGWNFYINSDVGTIQPNVRIGMKITI